MSDDKTQIDQLVEGVADVFVYAPIGLFFEGPSLLPKLARQGRVHANNARLFGQFAVKHGEVPTNLHLSEPNSVVTLDGPVRPATVRQPFPAPVDDADQAGHR